MSEAIEQANGVVWILVDQSSRETTFEGVARHLEQAGAEVHLVTMSEALGSGIKEALSGGAERLLRGVRVAIRGRNQDEDLVGAVRRAKPDVLAVTSPGQIRALGLLETVSGIASLQVGVFADYGFDPAWTRSALHAFIVPHERFRERLCGDGFSEERVLVAGPAIQDRFARELDRAAERESLGFGDRKVVLVRAQSIDTHSLEKLVFQATLVDADARFVFHHGGDGVVATTLRKAASQYGLKAAMFGQVDDLERYVLAADAILGSVADPLVPEILALDRPLMLVGSQDAAQVSFLTGVGAARWVEDVLRLGSEIDHLLEDDALAGLSAAAAELSQTKGTEDVARALATALRNRQDWMQPVQNQDAPDDAPSSSGDDDDSSSPFETIGETQQDDSDRGTTSSTPVTSRLSKAEAKEQLAALILTEREIEKRLIEAEKNQTRWRGRLEMAREWKEEDLAAEAEGILRGYMDEFEKLQQERAAIGRQKDKLKAAARGGAPAPAAAGDDSRLSDIEKRFRKMEVDSDLDDLKDRIRREMGD